MGSDVACHPVCPVMVPVGKPACALLRRHFPLLCIQPSQNILQQLSTSQVLKNRAANRHTRQGIFVSLSVLQTRLQ